VTIGENDMQMADAAADGDLAPAGIDPVRLAVALDVFDELDALPVDHPDAIAVRRATARLYGQDTQPQGEAGRRRR
jgi:hypothetical protein